MNEHASATGSLSDYECIERLAEGSTADVFLVRHKQRAKMFAMKVLPCSIEEPWTRRTLHARREQYILHLLNHPFICGLYDSFHDNERLYLVLHFQCGGTLDDVRKFNGGRLPERAVRFYVTEMITALEYVHTMGFIYRDLKPHNVLIGDDGHIKLTDFGVAREGTPVSHGHPHMRTLPNLDVASQRSSDVSTTLFTTSSDEDDLAIIPSDEVEHQEEKSAKPAHNVSLNSHHFVGVDDRLTSRSNSFVGSIEYMAPEMICQEENHTTGLDWWALGCTIYELLYGSPPFQNLNRDRPYSTRELFRRALTGKLTFPSTPRVSAACKSFLHHLLVVDKSNRLGHNQGSTEVKQHPFLGEVRWATLYHVPAPFRPISKCQDCSIHCANTQGTERLLQPPTVQCQLSDWIKTVANVSKYGEGSASCHKQGSKYEYSVAETRSIAGVLQKIFKSESQLFK